MRAHNTKRKHLTGVFVICLLAFGIIATPTYAQSKAQEQNETKFKEYSSILFFSSSNDPVEGGYQGNMSDGDPVEGGYQGNMSDEDPVEGGYQRPYSKDWSKANEVNGTPVKVIDYYYDVLSRGYQAGLVYYNDKPVHVIVDGFRR